MFSKWSILEKVEDRLEAQILHNVNYPFVRDEKDPNLLVYCDRPPEFYISCKCGHDNFLIQGFYSSVKCLVCYSSNNLEDSTSCVGSGWLFRFMFRWDYLIQQLNAM